MTDQPPIPMDEGDLGELHVGATLALQAGYPRVEIMPSQVLQLIDEVLHRRRAERSKAYALVERELRAAGIRRIDITEHVICATRPGEGDVLAERAPMPTLFGAVELLGPKETTR